MFSLFDIFTSKGKVLNYLTNKYRDKKIPKADVPNLIRTLGITEQLLDIYISNSDFKLVDDPKPEKEKTFKAIVKYKETSNGIELEIKKDE